MASIVEALRGMSRSLLLDFRGSNPELLRHQSHHLASWSRTWGACEFLGFAPSSDWAPHLERLGMLDLWLDLIATPLLGGHPL